jgi:glutamate synthase (NADPH/NADH) large chain
MTGGRVVVLGPTGRNFAAGMSGGVAYVWDQDRRFLYNCNMGTVELERVESREDLQELRDLIRLHLEMTGSSVAEHVLSDWYRTVRQFKKVMPIDYKRVLEDRQRHDEEQEVLVRLEGAAKHG